MPTYAALHYQAHILIAPHGAGLANIIFTHPERLVGVIEMHSVQGNWGPDTLPNPCHAYTAEMLGVPHSYTLHAQDGSLFGEEFFIDPSRVSALLDVIFANLTLPKAKEDSGEMPFSR